MKSPAFSCFALIVAATFAALGPGCSSDSDGGGGTSGTSKSSGTDGGATGGGGAGGSGGSGSDASTCTCDITYNEVEQVLTCGQGACINGEQFSCDSTSGSVDQGACSASAVDAGGSDAGGSDAAADAAADAGKADAAPSCLAPGADCDDPDDCCTGTFCGEDHVCDVSYGGACTASDQCESSVPPVDPGGSCIDDVCCANTGYPCTAPGPAPFCCSGTCGAPNTSGISFCD